VATSSPALLDPARSTPDVAEQRARTRAIVAPRSGERGLDIGCGFGLLACELARDVGPTGRVMGVDAVPDMIAACEERARHDAVSGRTEFRQADAEALPFAPGTFDFVTAMQVYEYMADVERGLAEAARVLKPRGRLAALETDWESCVWHAGDRDRTGRVLKAWEERFAHPHLPAQLPELLRRTVDFSPEQVGFLQYGRVADTTAAREQLGFSPKWSSPHAFEDFAASRLRKLVTQEQVTTVEREALAALRRAAGWFGGGPQTGGAR